ncbi:hypothetical protein CCACVL1_03725 [Corchorus capsularis]|uniref:Uncharacterized protein n=1 Tax=Corchorus capsularis TaxID=210143 RepID=A0A1R3JXQ6_COCAP|nr:hypothetical protein CCACVL1_03725 [Corchorus capsularis]
MRDAFHDLIKMFRDMPQEQQARSEDSLRRVHEAVREVRPMLKGQEQQPGQLPIVANAPNGQEVQADLVMPVEEVANDIDEVN